MIGMLATTSLGYMPATMHVQRATSSRHAVSPQMSGGFDFSKMREGFDDMMAGAEKSFNDMFNQKSSKMSYDEMVEYCRDDESVGCDLEMLDKLKAETKGQGFRVAKPAKVGVEWSKGAQHRTRNEPPHLHSIVHLSAATSAPLRRHRRGRQGHRAGNVEFEPLLPRVGAARRCGSAQFMLSPSLVPSESSRNGTRFAICTIVYGCLVARMALRVPSWWSAVLYSL